MRPDKSENQKTNRTDIRNNSPTVVGSTHNWDRFAGVKKKFDISIQEKNILSTSVMS
jgi:hypothetical protein